VPKLEKAKQFLTSVLANSKLPATEVEAAAANAGLSWRTVIRAAEELNIDKAKDGKKWVWQIT
jgi:hypothetical protein